MQETTKVFHKQYGTGIRMNDDYELCNEGESIIKFDNVIKRESYNTSSYSMLYKNFEYIEIVKNIDLI